MINYLEQKRQHLEAIESAFSQITKLEKLANKINKSFNKGGKVLTAGNGGSCSDAMHFTAELVGRFEIERDGLPSVCLGNNPATFTAISNDYNFEKSIQREGISLACSKDIVTIFSTSGLSNNLILLSNSLKKRNIYVFGFLGKGGGKLKSICNDCIIVDSQITARVQEAHIFLIHLLCSMIDNSIT